MEERNLKIGQRIKEARERLEMTQETLGSQLGLNKSTIQRYETGQIKNIKLPVIQNMAIALKVSPEWISLKTDDPKPKNVFSDIGSVIPNSKIYQIPVFESVSAGFGAYASDEIIDYIPAVIMNESDVEDTIAIHVTGDSMYPKIEDGDTIVVRKQTSVDSGSIAVVLLDGEEGLVKKVNYGDDWIELVSLNPEYQTRRLEGEEVLRIQVVGLVKQIIKTL